MAITAKRILPVQVPGKMGDYESYIELSDSDGYLDFKNGETLSMAPTRGDVQSTAYTNKNIRVLLNEGGDTPSNVQAGMRTLFAKNAFIRNLVNGAFPDGDSREIPLNQYTPEQCAGLGSFLYNNRHFGLVCGEAQENEGKWKFQSQYASTQMKQMLQSITDYAKANPTLGIINAGLTYCSQSTISPGKDNNRGTIANYQTNKDALTDTQKSRDLLAAFEWDFYRHWGHHYYETGTVPIINAYCTTDDFNFFWRTILQMELVAKANEGLSQYSDPRTMLLFFWNRARELQPYTEQYKIDMGGGVTMLQAEWPTANPNVVYALNRIGFRQGKHVINWDNPYGFGKDKNILPEPGDRISYVGGNTGGRQVVSKYPPVPHSDTATYPYPTAPFGYNDLSPVAGKSHCRQTNFLNKRPVPVQWSIGGTAGPAPDAGYVPYCIDNHKPLVRAAVDGNRAIVDVFDPEGWGGGLTVNLGGSFGNVTLDCWGGVDNQFHLQA